MTIPFTQHFDACLPAVATPVRITSIYDAQIFTRRWVIRDKDRELKLLLRKLERANRAMLINQAMSEFKQTLSRAAYCRGPLRKAKQRPNCVAHDALPRNAQVYSGSGSTDERSFRPAWRKRSGRYPVSWEEYRARCAKKVASTSKHIDLSAPSV